MNFLEVNNISKTYEHHTALGGVSFSIPKGSIYGLLGPNGAGKTSLIRIITQIIPADGGEVLLDGKSVSLDDIIKVGYLPEERGLYKKMKVAEQLVYLGRLKGLSKSEAKDKTASWLDKLDLADWSNKKVETLSKGMQQKVQFIAAIMHDPQLIILDEPFSGFDPVNAEHIKKEILELKEKGCTIIFSTHRMESVEELCDNIALINQSKIVLQGNIEEIKNQYKEGVFEIEGKGDIEGLGLELVSLEKSDDSSFKAVIKLQEGEVLNNIIQELTKKVELSLVKEKIPTMNEIFVKEVHG